MADNPRSIYYNDLKAVDEMFAAATAAQPARTGTLEPVVRAMQIQAEQHADPAPRRSAPFDHEAALASIITKNREVDAARAVHKRRAEDTKSAKQVLDDLATQLSEMIAEFGARLDGTGDQPTLFDAAAHVDVDGP